MSSTKTKRRASPKSPEKIADHELKTQTFSLELTKHELVHLRDLASVLGKTDPHTTIGQMLANVMGRDSVDRSLWKKIAETCIAASVPVGDEAPDFQIVQIAPPQLWVHHVQSDGGEQ